MKVVLVLACALCCVQCRKANLPLDKNANTAFINMESGGQLQITPQQPSAPSSGSAGLPAKVAPTQAPAVTKPAALPAPTVTTTTAKPLPLGQQSPSQIRPVPVSPPLVSKPGTTPGPGSVKQLINYYDSQGKASVIRPYSYSQAVKQG